MNTKITSPDPTRPASHLCKPHGDWAAAIGLAMGKGTRAQISGKKKPPCLASMTAMDRVLFVRIPDVQTDQRPHRMRARGLRSHPVKPYHGPIVQPWRDPRYVTRDARVTTRHAFAERVQCKRFASALLAQPFRNRFGNVSRPVAKGQSRGFQGPSAPILPLQGRESHQKKPAISGFQRRFGARTDCGTEFHPHGARRYPTPASLPWRVPACV